MLLARVFYFVESGKITEPIYTPDLAQPGTSNKDFLRSFIGDILQKAFPNLQPYVLRPPWILLALTMDRAQIRNFIDGLFADNNDITRFKTNLRDFLISLKEFSGDNAELFTEDREVAQQAQKHADMERAQKVGGLLKPADLDADDDL